MNKYKWIFVTVFIYIGGPLIVKGSNRKFKKHLMRI